MALTGSKALSGFRILGFCIIWSLAAPLPARTTAVVDDSGTLPYNAALALRWQQASPSGAGGNLMVGTLQLRVHLNLAPYQRHTGRIYLVLPLQQPGAMNVSWTTQGRLLPGQVASGGRTLVYAGPITGPFMEDTVQLTITVDGRRLTGACPVNFRFEIDED
jgi:hypothetical protein